MKILTEREHFQPASGFDFSARGPHVHDQHLNRRKWSRATTNIKTHCRKDCRFSGARVVYEILEVFKFAFNDDCRTHCGGR